MMMQVDVHDLQVMDNSMVRIVKQCTSVKKIQINKEQERVDTVHYWC